MEEALIQEIYQEIMSYKEEDTSYTYYWNMRSKNTFYPQELNDVFITASGDKEILGALEKYAQEVLQRGFLEHLIREYFITEIRNYLESPDEAEPITGEVILEMIFEEFALKYEFYWWETPRIIFPKEETISVGSYPLIKSVEENSTAKTKYWAFHPEGPDSLVGIFFPAKTPEGALLKMDSYIDHSLITSYMEGRTEEDIIEDLHTPYEIEIFSFDTIKIVE